MAAVVADMAVGTAGFLPILKAFFTLSFLNDADGNNILGADRRNSGSGQHLSRAFIVVFRESFIVDKFKEC